MSKHILYNIKEIHTVDGGVKKGSELGHYTVIHDGAIVVEQETIAWVGTMAELVSEYGSDVLSKHDVSDCEGMVVTPGLIDPHTHLVFGGSRTSEYALKLAGKEYMEILRSGGGILSTVRRTRETSEEVLYQRSKAVLDDMLSCGVTTIEAKSGYGLDKETELKQLRIVKQLHETHPIDLVSTFMGAHALPAEFSSTMEYLSFLQNEVLPVIQKENLAAFVDIFCESGIFELEETRVFMEAAKDMGFALKMHADEIVSLGGAGLAAALGSVSAEHLMKASKEDLRKMAHAGVVAVLLPVTSFHLNKPFADVEFMKSIDMVMTLATDYNPGSSPCSDLLWAMRIGSRGYRLQPREILSMVTMNAAKAIGRETAAGSIEKGKQADLTMFRVDTFDDVVVNMTPNCVGAVMKKGKMVYTKTC